MIQNTKYNSPGIIDVIAMQKRNRAMRSWHPDACPRWTKRMMMQRVVEFLAKLHEKCANTDAEFQNQVKARPPKVGLPSKLKQV